MLSLHATFYVGKFLLCLSLLYGKRHLTMAAGGSGEAGQAGVRQTMGRAWRRRRMSHAFLYVYVKYLSGVCVCKGKGRKVGGHCLCMLFLGGVGVSSQKDYNSHIYSEDNLSWCLFLINIMKIKGKEEDRKRNLETLSGRQWLENMMKLYMKNRNRQAGRHEAGAGRHGKIRHP